MKKLTLVVLTGLCFLALPVQAQINLLHQFTGGGTDGKWPCGSLIISGSTAFGMTMNGGDSDFGTIFKVELDGTGFALLHEFAGGAGDGSLPFGSLVVSGSTLYGMTLYGGDHDLGTIFKIQTDGSDYTLLREFAGWPLDGSYPNRSLVLSDSTLYGMTFAGGASGTGTIFKMQTDGSGFSLLHEFADGEGAYPKGDLILSGSSLYGMTYDGGDYDFGTIFKLQIDGSGFILLHEFAGGADDGKDPFGNLIISDTSLYGMTYRGGDSDTGTLFKIQTDGSGFTLLREFIGGPDDGAQPFGSLLLSGLTLYGMTENGGGSNSGTIFKVRIDGSGFALLHEFDRADGAYPEGSLVLSGSTLYGMAEFGGGTFDGVIFSLPFLADAPSIIATSPGGGEIWTAGTVHPINWLKYGVQNANVKIALWKDASTLVQMVATTTPNDGAYDWMVPATLATGSNYFVRIRTVDNLVSDYSAKFSIVVPAIAVTAPNFGTTWARGTTKAITWNKIGTQDANVRIQLYKGTAKALDITLNTPNDGSFDWAIPATLANAVYTVRITTLDGKVKGISKSFTIARGMIKVTAPAAGAHWQRGVVHAITWTGEGALNANVRIQLVKGDQVSTIVATTANDGSFDWTIPANRVVAANYRIRVTTVDNQITAQSGLFAITTSAD